MADQYRSQNPPPSYDYNAREFVVDLLSKRPRQTRQQILDAAGAAGKHKPTVAETLDRLLEQRELITEDAPGGVAVYRLAGS